MNPKVLLPIISLVFASRTPAQVSQQPGAPVEANSAARLLEDTAANYKTLTGYELHGKLNLQIPGSVWQYNGEVTLIGPHREVLDDGTVKMNRGAGRVGGMVPVKMAADSDEKPARIATPFMILGRFDAIANDAIHVERTGSEVVHYNGKGVACEILKVTYAPSTSENYHAEEVTYWIDPASHLVLKKALIFNAGRSIPRALWTITYDTLKFDRPLPQWVLDMKDILEVKVRNEWIGKEAPEFSLPSMDGSTVKLTSFPQRVVLLDFWSITCGPCKLEMPMLEEVARENQSRGVELLGISFDPADKSKRWLERNNRTMRTLTDADFAENDAYQVQGIPALVLIGRDGKVKEYWEGTVPKDMLQAAIDQALKK